MKKLKLMSVLALTVLSLNSCAELQNLTKTSESVNKNDAPKFTTIDKLLTLSPGMTYAEVVSTLGCEAYDIYTLNNAESKTVLIWNYKKVKRNEEPTVMKRREGATSGSEVICCQEVAYLTFDNKKLVSLVTDAGKGSSQNASENAENNAVPQQAEKKGLMKLF